MPDIKIGAIRTVTRIVNGSPKRSPFLSRHKPRRSCQCGKKRFANDLRTRRAGPQRASAMAAPCARRPVFYRESKGGVPGNID